jgi:formiminotetrahydrofolate cyclodeaminase
MSLDASTPISTFLAAAAAKQPTPGGGAVAALSAALACSMLEMVLNYSVGRKGLEAQRPQLQAALDQAGAIRKSLESLIEADQTAYLHLTATKKLPDSPERTAQLNPAIARAIEVPREIANHSLRILELADEVADVANPWLLSDLAVSADLATASVRSAIYNVRVNLPEVGDANARSAEETLNSTTLYKATQLIQKVSPRIWARIRQNTAS